MGSARDVATLSGPELLAATRKLVHNACGLEAKLLVYLGEIDERRLYLEYAFPSMFAFCIGELGFSEGAAYSRITIARAARRLPAVLDAIRAGQVHLAGMRVLVPHLTEEHHREVLAEATGKSKREIEELVARISPRSPVPTVVRKLPGRSPPVPAGPQPPAAPPILSSAPESTSLPFPQPNHEAHRPVIAPLAADAYKIQFTAGRAFCDKLRQARDLLRHRVPDGDLATVLDKALDVLIEQVKKQRFATGRKPRQGGKAAAATASPGTVKSRHIPDGIKRTVFERDGGRCTFVDARGVRCAETGALELDHLDGFARTRSHEADRIRLLCRAHNQHAAEQMYGRTFMEQARASQDWPSIRPGTSPPAKLL